MADSLAQNKPVVSIRHHNEELKRDPKTTRQTAATSEGKTELECSRLSFSPYASDCAATVTTTLATVICPVTNPDNNFASCLLPATLRRRSGHESSADWLTATEQRDKNVAAAYSCLFYSTFHPSTFHPFVQFSSVLSFYSLWFYPLWVLPSVLFSLLFVPLGSCSLALTLLLSLSVLLFSSPLFSLLVFFETLLSSSSWIVLRAFFRSLLLVHEFSFVYRRVGGRRILELGAAFQSSSLFGQPVVRGATFLHQHLSVRIILIESLVAAVIPQVFQRPSQCASIGSLSFGGADDHTNKAVFPTVPFCLLGACVGLWVAVFFLFVFSLALPAEPAGHARFYYRKRGSASYIVRE